MSKIFDEAIEREEKRLEGEEQFINEPKTFTEHFPERPITPPVPAHEMTPDERDHYDEVK